MHCEGAINAPGWSASSESIAYAYFTALGKEYGFDIDAPVGELDDEIIDIILYGTGSKPIKVNYKNAYRSKSFSAPFEGIIPNLQRRYEKNQMRYGRDAVEALMSDNPCPRCKGARLKLEPLAVTVG